MSLLAALSALAIPSLVHADVDEETSAGQIADVVVTAQRYEQSMQKVPIAMSVLSASDIDARNIGGVEGLQSAAPNVRLVASSGGSYSSAHIFVRGVGQRDYDVTQDAQVPVYVDGVYLARTTGSMVDFMDIERIEVLRGPQGTLFGRNAVGGAVQIVSKRPTTKYEAVGRLTAGRFDRLDVEGMLNIPLGENLLMRVSGAAEKRDGYAVLQPTGTESGDRKNHSLRAQWLWSGENGEALLRFDTHSRRANMGLQVLCEVTNPAAPALVALNQQLGQLGLPLVDDNLIPANPYSGLSFMDTPDSTDVRGGSLELSRTIGAARIKSITAYRTMDQRFAFDYDGTQYAMSEGITMNDQWQFSQELQLLGNGFGDRLQWIFGLFYFKEAADQRQDLVGFPFEVIRTGPGMFDFINDRDTGFPLTYRGDQETESQAAYLQLGYRLLDRLTATVGVRVTRDEKDYFSIVGTRAVDDIRPAGTVSKSWSDVSPKFALDYQATDNLMLYASMSKGYQSGGFNGRVYAPREPESFDPQELWAYQVGMKSDWLDRRLRLNADAYWYDYENYQGLAFIPGTQNLVVSNIASLEVYGAEVDMLAKLTNRLELVVAAGYLHQEITDVNPGAVGIQTNFKLPESPTFTGQFGAQYRLDVGQWGSALMRADYAYTGTTQFRLGITPAERQGGYGLTSARVSFQPRSENWEVSLFGTNLGNKRYRTYAQYSSAIGVTAATWAPPMEWGISLTATL
jgi:iron complex outermembrane receptor protein